MKPATVRESTLRRDGITAAVLAVCTFTAFAPALDYRFVNFDDGHYVLQTEQVTKGLSLSGAGWAFTTYHTANWHPLTWLSLQLDGTLWRKSDGSPDPYGFHQTNVLLHAANAALLFLALRALTGAFWPSAAAALLFAVHPLRVESVAWVSERKDDLSVFFGLLALWAYADYARRPSAWRYLAVAAAFAASLLSKPMLVTLPFLLLVLDWWPLQRWSARGYRLVLEKVPLFALVLGSSFFTFAAQREGGAVKTLEAYPIGVRLENAAVSYVDYLSKTVWPVRLSPFYPHPGDSLPHWLVAVAGVLLVVLTAVALALRRRAPYLLAGWLWYLGTLVPAIGLVQVGTQAMADRYSYFPQIGLLVAICWGAAAVAGKHGQAALTAAGVAAVVFAAFTQRQLPIWHDSFSLWDHARRTTGDCSMTLINLGLAVEEMTSDEKSTRRPPPEDPERYYRRAIEVEPGAFNAHYNLGLLLMRRGRLHDAIAELRETSRLVPSFPLAHLSLGNVYELQGKADLAADAYAEAIRLTPGLAAAHRNAGLLEKNRGNFAKAAERFGEWARLQPDSPDARTQLAAVLLQLGRTGEAVDQMKEAVHLDPDSAQRYLGLGRALEKHGDLEGAAASFEQAARLLETSGQGELARRIRREVSQRLQRGRGGALSLPEESRNRGAFSAQPAADVRASGSGRARVVAAALAVAAFAVFSPALRCGFVNFDDPVYASTNPHVQRGLTADGVAWAFTTFELSNWHPLTWLSLQLDATIWKKDPFGFHQTNVLLHAANAALLFLALRGLTGAFWPSAAVALLFAVHPLRVESVAWIAERKDVLSVFFGLLALSAYAEYVRRPSVWRYAAVTAAFAASLMSKPMLVTLPFLLLVLDWWPLDRIHTLADWRRPAVEKLPLLALAAVVSFVTYRAQSEQGAVLGLEAIPPATRLGNAAISYLTYLALTAWPTGLAVYYPYPKEPRIAAAAVSAVFLVAATVGAVALRRRAPYVLAGWLWYLGTLVPVIGLVQVGRQSHADRYSYFPQIGVLLALCWGVAELARRRREAAATAAAVAAVLLAALTWGQLQHWRDSVTLWERVKRVAEPDATVLINLGEAWTEKENRDAAAAAYREALRVEPNSLAARINLGGLLFVQGKADEAVAQLRAACDAHPDSVPAHTTLADAYCKLGRIELTRGDLGRAAGWLNKALGVRPDSADAHAGLGAVYLRQEKPDEGLAQMREAVRCDPESARRHFELGVVLERQNKLDESAESLWQAVERDPKSRDYRNALNVVLNRLVAAGRPDLARKIGERLQGL